MVINPIIYNENGRGQDIFSQNFENRIIHLVGPIEDEMAATVVAQLLSLDAKGNDDIYLYINSPGGSVSAGLAIYDTMKHIKSDVCKDTDRDYWLNAESAKAYGIVDRIL